LAIPESGPRSLDARAKRLPPGWEQVRFGDVVRDVKVSVDPITSGLVRYVAGEHMDTDDLRIRRWGTIGEGYLGPAFHRKFVKGQVLYGSRRTYLRKVARADFDGVCANTTFTLQPKDDRLMKELLPHIMQTESFAKHSIKQSRGSVNPYVNWKDLAWYEFALPPKPEQRRIAQVLGEVEEVTEGYRRVAGLTVTVEDGLLPAVELPARNSWEVLPLREALRSCKYGLSVRPEESGRYAILRMTNIEAGHVTASDLKYVDLDGQTFEEYRVQAGDLLFNRTNSAELVGKVGIFDGPGDFVFASYLLRLRPRRDLVEPAYLNAYLNSAEGQRNILAYATRGVSQSNINARNLQRVPVPIPPMEEQRETVALIQSVRKSRQELIKALDLSKAVARNLRESALTPPAIGAPSV
jgi:type I restriction enzyme, S subunit